MVGVAGHMDEHSSLRKVRKPMIEKRRRDRMNVSIEKIKNLLAASGECSTSAKLDKADILEMAVSFIARQTAQTSPTTTAVQTAYRSGYNDSARETIHYLRESRVVSPGQLDNVENHLNEFPRGSSVNGMLTPEVEAVSHVYDVTTTSDSSTDSLVMNMSISSDDSRDRSCTEVTPSRVWRPW